MKPMAAALCPLIGSPQALPALCFYWKLEEEGHPGTTEH